MKLLVINKGIMRSKDLAPTWFDITVRTVHVEWLVVLTNSFDTVVVKVYEIFKYSE